MFELIAQNFKLIEEDTIDVIIPFDETARALIHELQNSDPITKELRRRLGTYSVSVRANKFDKIDPNDLSYFEGGNFYILTNIEKYSKETGLII